MKKMLATLLCVQTSLCICAQQNLGIQNSNYAGIQGSLLNPSSIADSKLKWDVNVISAGETFDNTFLFSAKSQLHLFGFGRIISGSIHEDLFVTHYDPANASKLYDVTFSGQALGPSFFLKV